MRSPFTGVIFALELTHEWSAGMALMIAASSAYGISVLILKRSVLTEKVARKGFHLTREYSVDPLEILFVRRSEEHTSELQSLMSISYAVCCMTKKTTHNYISE